MFEYEDREGMLGLCQPQHLRSHVHFDYCQCPFGLCTLTNLHQLQSLLSYHGMVHANMQTS
jgi:hypothetical protein